MKLSNLIKLAKVKTVDKLKWQATESWHLVFFNKYFFSRGKLKKLRKVR